MKARYVAELKALASVQVLWAVFVLSIAGWTWLTVPLPGPASTLPWLELVLPQLAALLVVAAGVPLDLPATRWPRPADDRLRRSWPWVVLCAPLAPIVAVLRQRDRRASQSTPGSPEVTAAFVQLLRFPRALGLRFLSWCALAAVVDAIVLGLHASWPRPVIVGLAVLWIALLGPLAAILIGLGRVIIRPEYLSAPREQAGFRRTTSLRLRLAVNASIATLGLIVAPLTAGYLWSVAHPEAPPLAGAMELADELSRLAARDAEEELGARLARHPHVALRLGDRRFGPRDRALSQLGGVNREEDRNGDGQPDLVIRSGPGHVIAVPVPSPGPPALSALVVGGVLALAAALGTVILVAADMHRDVGRAAAEADAVARDRQPPPRGPAGFLTYEVQQLVDSMDRLVHRITEANIAKYVAIEKAKEADRLKSQFLANMSHDLRSPLNAILGFSELLLSGIDGDLSEEQREMVKLVHENGRTLLQEIDDILDTAKIEASRLDLHPEPTPAVTLVNRAIHSAKKRQRHPIEFDVDAAAGLPPAVVDPYRTVQALENVLHFASERMASGRISVQIRQGIDRRGRMIVVQIHTPTRPATAEQLARARRGFYRIPGHHGLGLGLPIAGAILELEGGSLGIEDLGDGMVFTVQLCAPETRRGREPVRPSRSEIGS